jgi:hypothetical protein
VTSALPPAPLLPAPGLPLQAELAKRARTWPFAWQNRTVIVTHRFLMYAKPGGGAFTVVPLSPRTRVRHLAPGDAQGRSAAFTVYPHPEAPRRGDKEAGEQQAQAVVLAARDEQQRDAWTAALRAAAGVDGT